MQCNCLKYNLHGVGSLGRRTWWHSEASVCSGGVSSWLQPTPTPACWPPRRLACRPKRPHEGPSLQPRPHATTCSAAVACHRVRPNTSPHLVATLWLPTPSGPPPRSRPTPRPRAPRRVDHTRGGGLPRCAAAPVAWPRLFPPPCAVPPCGSRSWVRWAPRLPTLSPLLPCLGGSRQSLAAFSCVADPPPPARGIFW